MGVACPTRLIPPADSRAAPLRTITGRRIVQIVRTTCASRIPRRHGRSRTPSSTNAAIAARERRQKRAGASLSVLAGRFIAGRLCLACGLRAFPADLVPVGEVPHGRTSISGRVLAGVLATLVLAVTRTLPTVNFCARSGDVPRRPCRNLEVSSRSAAVQVPGVIARGSRETWRLQGARLNPSRRRPLS